MQRRTRGLVLVLAPALLLSACSGKTPSAAPTTATTGATSSLPATPRTTATVPPPAPVATQTIDPRPVACSVPRRALVRDGALRAPLGVPAPLADGGQSFTVTVAKPKVRALTGVPASLAVVTYPVGLRTVSGDRRKYKLSDFVLVDVGGRSCTRVAAPAGTGGAFVPPKPGQEAPDLAFVAKRGTPGWVEISFVVEKSVDLASYALLYAPPGANGAVAAEFAAGYSDAALTVGRCTEADVLPMVQQRRGFGQGIDVGGGPGVNLVVGAPRVIAQDGANGTGTRVLVATVTVTNRMTWSVSVNQSAFHLYDRYGAGCRSTTPTGGTAQPPAIGPGGSLTFDVSFAIPEFFDTKGAQLVLQMGRGAIVWGGR